MVLTNLLDALIVQALVSPPALSVYHKAPQALRRKETLRNVSPEGFSFVDA
jgi:hypothetical protein